jgi:hypothetical protein
MSANLTETAENTMTPTATTYANLPFMKRNTFTINLADIPKYPEFDGEFIEKLDYPLMNCIYNSEFLNDKPEIKAMLLGVLKKVNKKTGNLKVIHNQRHKLGRYYADGSISIIPLSKYAKHTVFQFLGWKDVDMKKGHPTIAIEMAKTIGHELMHFQYYIDNYINIVKQLSLFYSADPNFPLDKNNIKFLFNILTYGGAFKTWVEKVE